MNGTERDEKPRYDFQPLSLFACLKCREHTGTCQDLCFSADAHQNPDIEFFHVGNTNEQNAAVLPDVDAVVCPVYLRSSSH